MVREEILREYLRKRVRVIVDRPVGYHHGDILYPVNYGYLPGVIAGDGEEQDAYILGVSTPVSEFTGQVIGAIRRWNDCEDKLVVAPEGVRLHQGEIAEAVHFQEQFFDYTVESLYRKSCGVIAYRDVGNVREYLIVRQSNHVWSFPKGHMDRGESELQTALRELFEETGLSAMLETDRKVSVTYGLSPLVNKEQVLFLGEVTGKVTMQAGEIEDYLWVAGNELGKYLHPNTLKACQGILK